MTYEMVEAIAEIMDIPPIFRRDYIIKYLKMNLTEKEARRFLFDKIGFVVLDKLVEEGYLTKDDILDQIGKDRIMQFCKTRGIS